MKKLLSCLVSVGVLASTMTAFAASSVFNPNKDPNGDGHLTIADSAFIKQFLVGKYEVSDLTQLDVDDNDVVSDVDDVYVRMYDAGMLSSTEQTAEPVNINNTSTSRNYRVYNAQNGAYKRNYSLSVSYFDNSANTRNIIGENSQQPDWSNVGVAKIMGNSSCLGTGFVVGKHTIATASHVIKSEIISDVLLFDEDGTSHSFTPVEYHIPTSYILDELNEFDYSLITIEEDLSEYMSFNLGVVTDNADDNELPITCVGFPGYLNNPNGVHVKAMSNGEIINATSIILTHNADVENGNSGSPIYTIETVNNQTYNTVVGIHIMGVVDNYALRFNSHILKFLKGNTNILY